MPRACISQLNAIVGYILTRLSDKVVNKIGRAWLAGSRDNSSKHLCNTVHRRLDIIELFHAYHILYVPICEADGCKCYTKYTS